MSAYETRSSQFGLIDHQRTTESHFITLVEPAKLFSSEGRKGNLYILVESDQDLTRGHDVCMLVTRILRKTFYEDSSLSVTSSLREALREANKAIYQHNLNAPSHKRSYVGVTCAVVKGYDLFIAQVSPSQSYVLTETNIRAMPTHQSWNPAHTSASPFIKSGSLGSSLFIEPELYRCLLHAHDAILLCTSNLSTLLKRNMVEQILHMEESEQAITMLYTLCEEHSIADAHSLFIKLAPMPRGASQSLLGGSSRKKSWKAPSALLSGQKRKSRPVSDKQHAVTETIQEKDRKDLTTMPEQPNLPTDPLPRGKELDMGESLEQQYEKQKHHPAYEDLVQSDTRSSGRAFSETMGERDDYEPVRPNQSALDVHMLPPAETPKHSFLPKHTRRPWIDMTWQERIELPFAWFRSTMPDVMESVKQRVLGKDEEEPHPSTKPVEEERPPFPWVQLLALVLLIALLILYGTNLSRQSTEQQNLAYISTARQYIEETQDAPDLDTALQKLNNAEQALDQVRASPLVTQTNALLWLPFKEVEAEYERSLGIVQRITFFDNPTILTQHPLPNGRFASVAVPPPTSSITDTYTLNALRYIYALDGDKNNARLYRIPRDGGVPEPLLNPDDVIQDAPVGSIQAIAWRIDNIVAVDQTAANFGYYFRQEGNWNYIRLGASEIWAPMGRIDMETYEGNLYFWGAEPGEVVKYSSGRYGDIPELWFNVASAESVDVETAIDMGIDGNIYLLTPDGTVLVFTLGTFERKISPEQITPPITAITRMFVTGTRENGYIFLLDTLNERIIQMDKQNGSVLQQIMVRKDSSIQLNQLTDIYVDDSAGKPILYLVNGGQIIRAEMPVPPGELKLGE